MIRINSMVKRSVGLEEFNQDLLHDEDKANALSLLSDELSGQAATDQQSFGLEEYVAVSRQSGLESLAIAAASAAAIAVLGIVYKVYKYFADKNLSESMSSTIEVLEDEDFTASVSEAVREMPVADLGPLLKRNVALLAMALRDKATVIPELGHPKDFIADIDYLPASIEVSLKTNKGEVAKSLAKAEASFEKQYNFLKLMVRKNKIKSDKIDTGIFNDTPKMGYIAAAQQLMRDITEYSAAVSEKEVITADELARGLFSNGLAATLKQAQRQIEDLEEFSARISAAAEKATNRLTEIRRSQMDSTPQASEEAVAGYIKYIKAMTAAYKDNLTIIIRVNKYITQVVDLVKNKIKD